MILIFPCGSRRSKGVPSGTGVFIRLLIGELWTPKLAQIFAYGKWLYPYRMLVHGASDLDQRCLKTRSSKDRCTFPQNIFAPTAKSPQNPILGDLSMRNLLHREPSVNRTLMELRRWNLRLYRYRKVLEGKFRIFWYHIFFVCFVPKIVKSVNF